MIIKTKKSFSLCVKNNIQSKTFLLLLFVSVVFSECNDSALYIPERNESLSEATYEDFRGKLLLAYEQKNNYSIAFQLANLKAPDHLVYKHLMRAVNDDVGHCQSIFEMNRLAVNYGFYKNPYKADTMQFYEVFDLCLQKLGADAYEKYDRQMLIEEEAYEKNKPKLDSALMNPALIATLKVMQENDQRYRKRLADARVTIAESERTKLWELQKSLDSLNLIKADSILLHHGYPDVQEVGADLENTIWFVLQHQEDIEVREKYRKLLESHLSEGQMEVYNRRTQHLKDNSN